jgi:hypothetical protein
MVNMDLLKEPPKNINRFPLDSPSSGFPIDKIKSKKTSKKQAQDKLYIGGNSNPHLGSLCPEEPPHPGGFSCFLTVKMTISMGFHYTSWNKNGQEW